MKKRYVLVAVAVSAIAILFFVIKPYYDFLVRDVRISPIRTLMGIRDGIDTVDGAVNILILGIPGGTHDGPLLSDSMVVAHIDFNKKSVRTLGIPRDLWSDTLKDRVNSAYAYGEAKEKGGGMKLSRAEIAAIIGEPVQYAAVINFSQFKELIDELGGITVEVERSFTDTKFPVEGRENDECGGDPEFSCRYKKVTFTKGTVKMDGETALTYVRSRHAEGEEGSDFARNKRQERVLSAVKRRVIEILSVPTVSNARRLYTAFDSFFERDMSNQQAADILRSVIFKKDIQIQALTIPRELFIVPPAYQYEGKYVLIPEGGDFRPIHDYVSKNFRPPTQE